MLTAWKNKHGWTRQPVKELVIKWTLNVWSQIPIQSKYFKENVWWQRLPQMKTLDWSVKSTLGKEKLLFKLRSNILSQKSIKLYLNYHLHGFVWILFVDYMFCFLLVCQLDAMKQSNGYLSFIKDPFKLDKVYERVSFKR